MINLFETNYDCAGCTACENICPTKAISMMSDNEGFLYPNINKKKCIECKKCIFVCPLKNPVQLKERNHSIDVYAIKHESDNVRLCSTSGGFFTALTDEMLNRGGVVYGAAFNNDMKVVHKSAVTKDERDEIRGSKYVQSDLNSVFDQLSNDLKTGKEVIFSGTPCQTAGLINLLNTSKQDYLKLIIIDIVCHGTPSPLIWKDYIKYLEESRNRKVVKYSFRDKQQGWRGYNINIEYEDGKSENNNDDSILYLNLYITNKILRPSCYKCKFANTNRPSDIMIGDYWGIEKKHKNFDDNLGVSLIYLNTKKGVNYFNEITSDLITLKSSIKDSLQMNLLHPTLEPIDRISFWKDYEKKGFWETSRKHTRKSIIRRIKNKALRVLNKNR